MHLLGSLPGFLQICLNITFPLRSTWPLSSKPASPPTLWSPSKPIPWSCLFFHNMFSSVAQSCPTLCEPMDCNTSGFPVHYQLLELAQTHVHRVGDDIQWSCPVIHFSSHLQSFPASGSFAVSQFFTSGDQSIGASASASVLPMNIQDWFPLRLTGLISL